MLRFHSTLGIFIFALVILSLVKEFEGRACGCSSESESECCESSSNECEGEQEEEEEVSSTTASSCIYYLSLEICETHKYEYKNISSFFCQFWCEADWIIWPSFQMHRRFQFEFLWLGNDSFYSFSEFIYIPGWFGQFCWYICKMFELSIQDSQKNYQNDETCIGIDIT